MAHPLRSLTITGFKSFAKSSELEFTSPITAIVGPNGSGKSNVAEAFRFVLGEQSVKSLRGQRGEDLIWGGTKQLSRGNRASVKVELDNTAHTLSLDYDVVTIERVIHRDGQNEYKLNDSVVRRKDVQELLAEANIGSSGHHIISQGEADRILRATPRERRDMLEDALGLKIYKYKKQESQKKLEKTQQNVHEVQALRRENAPHLTQLKKQVERIERSRAIQTELRSKYAEYFRREDIYVTHEYERLTQAKQEPAQKLAEAREQLRKAQETLDNAQADHRKQDETQSEQQAALDALHEAQAKTKQSAAEVSRLEGQLGYIDERLRATSQSSGHTDTRMIPAAALEQVTSQIEANAEKAQRSDDAERLKRALSDIVHNLRAFLKKETQDTAPDTSPDEAERTRISSALDEARTAYQAQLTAEASASKAHAATAQAVTDTATATQVAERDVFKYKSEVQEYAAIIERLERELALIERDRDDFKRELQEAVALIGSAASQYISYEIRDENGDTVSDVAIAKEERGVQHDRRRYIEKLKVRLEELGDGETDSVIKEYEDAKQRDAFLAKEIADLEASAEKLRGVISDLGEQLHQQFAAGTKDISAEFHRFFALMFGGGSAELQRVALRSSASESADETSDAEASVNTESEEGIAVSVSLPNKRINSLDMLSGGERALTSTALIFAMSQINPPLFIVLDETDAALDEANSRRYGDMIEALAQSSQLILITHNRETMSRAGVLYGVTMRADAASTLLSVKFDEALASAK